MLAKSRVGLARPATPPLVKSAKEAGVGGPEADTNAPHVARPYIGGQALLEGLEGLDPLDVHHLLVEYGKKDLKKKPEKEYRLVVVGDADFIAKVLMNSVYARWGRGFDGARGAKKSSADTAICVR